MFDKVCNPQFGGSWTADTGSVSFNLCGLAARSIKCQSLHACIHPQWLQSKPSIKDYCTQLDAHKAACKLPWSGSYRGLHITLTPTGSYNPYIVEAAMLTAKVQESIREYSVLSQVQGAVNASRI